MPIKILLVLSFVKDKHDISTAKKVSQLLAYTKGNVLIDFEGKARHFDGGFVGSVRKILGRPEGAPRGKGQLETFGWQNTSQFLPRNIVPGAHKVMFTNHLHFHQSAVEIG